MSMGRPRNGGSLSRIRCGKFERRDRKHAWSERIYRTSWFKKVQDFFGGIWNKIQSVFSLKFLVEIFAKKACTFSLRDVYNFRQMIQYE